MSIYYIAHYIMSILDSFKAFFDPIKVITGAQICHSRDLL